MASESPFFDLRRGGSGIEEGSEEWREMCLKVREAGETHGYFLLMCDDVPNDLREEMFKQINTLFELPLQTKMKYKKPKLFRSYNRRNPITPFYEGFGIDDAHLDDEAESFTKTFWPEGNPKFCETLKSMSSKMLGVGYLVLKMIMAGYGIPNYASGAERMTCTSDFKLLKYILPVGSSDETEVTMISHTDKGCISILYDNDVQGLQMLTNSGEWIDIKIPKGGFAIIIGDILKAWSNGRLHAATHRVALNKEKLRYSFGLFPMVKEDMEIKVPNELVDDQHPLRYRPFIYRDFLSHYIATRNPESIDVFAGIQMSKENLISAKDDEFPLRVTRARAKILGSKSLGEGIPPYPSRSFKNEPKNKLRVNSKRVASDDINTCNVAPAGLQHKRRTVLTDVTNIRGESYDKCFNTSKLQARVHKKNITKVASGVSTENTSSKDDLGVKLDEELSSKRVVESHDNITAVTFDDKEPAEHCMSNSIREGVIADNTLSMQGSVKSDELMISPNKEIDMICEKLAASDCLAIVDIDLELKLKDPLVWSSYAPDIYKKTRVTEVERKPLTNYMEKLQKDISPSMRAILIDWLVEVTEEYKLVPDTLYLTVNLIDRYLSASLIQKQRLQLLGVTCMLIAS
ncbi:unnamed protein product [Lupinus luteus]|uniref:2-oxoglutarate-dependent dioxygenase DAO n=1 Tax=Lupinus luteus TaxID=3873 RepID=A0AAV1W996_LUPLU